MANHFLKKVLNSWSGERYRLNPQMYRAHYAVQRAVRRGELPHARTQICVDCGKQANCYDHRDYLKPLDVVPCCQGCNVRRGSGINATHGLQTN